jgi:AmiR/NasT family two-component response regulator
MGCSKCDHCWLARRRVPDRRSRVLIAASDAVTRNLVATGLLLAGFDAVPVADSRECPDVPTAAEPDVVVLFMTTPAPEAWRAAIDSFRRPGNSLVKVVLIVPVAEAEAMSCDVRLSADACLTTPFDLAELIRVLRELATARPGDLQRNKHLLAIDG